MSNQLKSLNQNIKAKDRKIKSTYKSMKRIRVYFLVQIYNLDKSDILFESDEYKLPNIKRVWKKLTHNEADRAKLLTMRPAKYTYQLVRIQTSGYVGGIILGGSRTVIEELTF